MECKSYLEYTTAKDGTIYKISEVVFDTKTDKAKPKSKPEPVMGVHPLLADAYVVQEHTHLHETHDPDKQCKAQHTAWPTSGLLVLERCENQCAFCGAVFKWTWFLRRHVHTIHAKRDYPNLTVAQSWTSPSGALKRCEKQVRKAPKLAAKLARKKQAETAPTSPTTQSILNLQVALTAEQTTVNPAFLMDTGYEEVTSFDWGFGGLLDIDSGSLFTESF